MSSAARWIASATSSLAHLLLLLAVSPFSRNVAWFVYRSWARVAFRIFGITTSLQDDNQGHPGPKPHLYIWLNQSSLVEVLSFVQLLPPWYTVANVEYAMMPLLGWAMVLLRNVVIVRQWKWQAKRGIERAATRLARGETWLISIEGARTRDGVLLPYKKGPVVLALRGNATIIPMAVHGAHDIMPLGEWRLRPGHIQLHLLPSIPTQGLTYEDREAVMARLRVLAEREFSRQRAQQQVPADLPVAPPARQSRH